MSMNQSTMKRVKVAADRWNFETEDGRLITPLGGNDWFGVERHADIGRQLDWDCAFWEAFAGHYQGHPAIWAWGLRNELLYTCRAYQDRMGDEFHAAIQAGQVPDVRFI